MNRKRFLGLAWLTVVYLIALPVLSAESYVIGPEDVLEIKFWQDNSLDAEIRVRLDGKISLDIIGEVEAAGLTTSQLERQIVKQMSRYNKAISQSVVRVLVYGYQKIYISGQVREPGKYTFEAIPSLWTLINEAGGITEFGDLSRVLIIRGGDDSGRVEVVNVALLVAAGKADELPRIRAGDTIEIPRTPAGLPARSLSDRPEAKNIFYVTGEVRSPGAMTLEDNIDILDAISLAGGPTDRADLKRVKVVSKDGLYTQVVKLNLNKYTNTGLQGRYFIRPEDNIIVPRRSGGLGTLRDWVTILGAVSTIVYIVDRLRSD